MTLIKIKYFTPQLRCGFLKRNKKALKLSGLFNLIFKWESIFGNTPYHLAELFNKAGIVIVQTIFLQTASTFGAIWR